MVAPGNHEKEDNFTEYIRRFQGIADFAGESSGTGTNFFYSFDVHNIHYVVIDTEVYKYQ